MVVVLVSVFDIVTGQRRASLDLNDIRLANLRVLEEAIGVVHHVIQAKLIGDVSFGLDKVISGGVCFRILKHALSSVAFILGSLCFGFLEVGGVEDYFIIIIS